MRILELSKTRDADDYGVGVGIGDQYSNGPPTGLKIDLFWKYLEKSLS